MLCVHSFLKFLNEQTSSGSLNILFLTTVLPAGRYGGGEIWSQNVVDALRAAGATVIVLGYDRRGVGASTSEIAVATRTVETVHNPFAAICWGAEAIYRSRPYTIQKWVGREYRALIRKLMAEQQPDVVIIDHAGMAWALDEIGRLPLIHVSHQAESDLYAQHAASGSRLAPIYRREARLLRKTEARLAELAAEVWTLGDEDAAYFHGLGGVSVRTLPVAGRPGWEAAASASAEGPDLALLGSWTWKPNRAGLVWFLSKVVPLLPKAWRIEVAGKYIARGLPQPDGVHFLGVVPDAFAFLRSAKRIAVPSFSSVGVPIKLLDGIAAGPPIVTTRTALARIRNAPSHVAATDDAEAFARALIEIKSSGAGGEWTRKRRQALCDALVEALVSLEGKLAAGP